jgi:hypothetical protein
MNNTFKYAFFVKETEVGKPNYVTKRKCRQAPYCETALLLFTY